MQIDHRNPSLSVVKRVPADSRAISAGAERLRPHRGMRVAYTTLTRNGAYNRAGVTRTRSNRGAMERAEWMRG
jgi:hypothetical protein